MQPGATSRNPAASLLASFFIPGLGTILSGETGKGLLILGAYVAAWVLVLFTIGFILVPAVWIYGMYDAVQSAKRYNRAQQGSPPT